jgi:hypothetical protein
MKILQILILSSILFTQVYANIFDDMIKISLKKDECKKIVVKYGRIQKLFQFRWTLYMNGGLVVLRSYDDIVAQNILYLNHKNQSFRTELFSRGIDRRLIPYILVKFINFDYEKKEANFELYLYDREKIIRLRHLKDE